MSAIRKKKLLLLIIELAALLGLLLATLEIWQLQRALQADLDAVRELAVGSRRVEPAMGGQYLPALTDQKGRNGFAGRHIAGKRTTATNESWRLDIPAIDVHSRVYLDYSEKWLRLGVARVGESGMPGEAGNFVLAGHNNVYGEVFRDLDELQVGDELLLSSEGRVHTYRVRASLIVEPDDIWVTLPTSTPTITLVSCYPYLLGTQRIVVFGDLVTEE